MSKQQISGESPAAFLWIVLSSVLAFMLIVVFLWVIAHV